MPPRWLYNDRKWEPVFVDRYDWKGWKFGKRDPFSCGYVDKVTYEIGTRAFSPSRFSLYSSCLADCKDHCLAYDKFNSCEGVYPKFSLFNCSLTRGFLLVYTLEGSAEQFICALFQEIVDSTPRNMTVRMNGYIIVQRIRTSITRPCDELS